MAIPRTEEDLKSIRSDEHKDTPLPECLDLGTTWLDFLEANGCKGVDPLSTEGVALQAQYLAALDRDQHPFDVLRKIALNPWASPRDRISAAKSMLEYGAAKVPSKLEVGGSGGGPIMVEREKLSALSTEELVTLEGLMAKMNKGK